MVVRGPKSPHSLCGMIDVRDVAWAGDLHNPTQLAGVVGTKDDRLAFQFGHTSARHFTRDLQFDHTGQELGTW